MNNPEYYLVNVMENIVTKVSTALTLANSTLFPNPIHYEHGYITELNETLLQWDKAPSKSELKFPLIWFFEPFTITRGKLGVYGTLRNGRLLIIQSTKKDYKAAERIDNVYNPIIYPIYRELITQICSCKQLGKTTPNTLKHDQTNRYYFSETDGKKSVFNDIVDCMELSNLEVELKNQC